MNYSNIENSKFGASRASLSGSQYRDDSINNNRNVVFAGTMDSFSRGSRGESKSETQGINLN